MKKNVKFKTSLHKACMMFLCLLFSAALLAQTKKSIKGTVFDEKGESVIGASVKVKNTTTGTITDVDGYFTLEVPDNSVIEVAFMGFISQDIPVAGKDEFKIILKEDQKLLDEVVVIGYGTMDKKELTSAISHVSSKDFLKVGAIDPAMQIQGKVAGVSITNTGSGDPNNGASIQVRGTSSRAAGLGPLVVIDGVPGGNLHNINENDIESIDVLKDGAAAAIYGTRGSNGVILVTTKKGSTDGQVRTSYNGYVSFDVITNQLKTLSASDFREKRVGGTDYGASTDWMDELTQTGIAQNHTLTISGGTAQSNYRGTIDARNATGVDIRSDREEYGARLSLNHTARNGLLKLTFNVAPRIITRNNSDWEVFSIGLLANPTAPVMDPNDPTGKRYFSLRGQEAGWNPVEKLRLEKSKTETKLLDWDATAKLNLLPLLAKEGVSDHTLSTQVTIAQQINDDQEYWFRPSTSTISDDTGYRGEAKQEYKKNRQQSLEWLVNYQFNKNNHNVGFMGGYSYQDIMYNSLGAENKNFSSDALGWDNLGNGEYMKEKEGRNGMWSNRNSSKLIAFFGRITYDYQKRYLMTASLRYEGSSKFGVNNKWGYFPAFSAGWRISEENFMKEISWIDDLKIRGDFGITGNQDFDSYKALATMGPFGDVYYNGAYYTGWAPNKNTNPNLKWEKAANWNVGVDFSVLNNKVTGSINYYSRKQQDLLGDYTVPVPPYLFDKMFVNVGTMKNTGIEIELRTDVVKTRNFSYNVGFVGATNQNKFVSFSNNEFKGNTYQDMCGMPGPGSPGFLQRLEEGKRVGNFYTYAYAGIDDNGNWLVWNKDNTEKIAISDANESDKRITGNGLPKFTASLNNTFTYKNWDLGLYFRGAFGYDIFDVHGFYYGLQSASSNANVLKDAYGKNAQITTGMNVLTDYFIEKGDYIKLDVVTLGYTLSLNNKWLDSIRLYGTIKNLATITSFSGVDPASYQVNGLTPGTFGGSKNYYPSTTQFLVGAQIDF